MAHVVAPSVGARVRAHVLVHRSAADHDLDLCHGARRPRCPSTVLFMASKANVSSPLSPTMSASCSLTAGDEVLDRHVGAEVVDGVPAHPQHEHDDVFADVVDVAAGPCR